MRWASNILWYIGRQSSILSMPTEGFVSASSSSFFSLIYWRCAQNQKIELQRPGERELLPEKSVKSWYQYNASGGVYGEKAFTYNTQRALQTSADAVLLNQNLSMWQARQSAGKLAPLGNLNLFDFNSQVPGLIGVNACILKPRTFVLWTPHKEHTESAIRWKHLAPCRFKCWTNLYSICISQPLKQLTSRY